MPYFVFRGIDAPGMDPVRATHREEHRFYIRQDQTDCRTLLGGPLLDQDGQRMIGTLLVMEATDRAAALRFLANDPYARAGLFATTELDPWQWGLGQPT